jgi:hypothetical protein
MILAIFNADPMNSDDPITIMVNRFKADQKWNRTIQMGQFMESDWIKTGITKGTLKRQNGLKMKHYRHLKVYYEISHLFQFKYFFYKIFSDMTWSERIHVILRVEANSARMCQCNRVNGADGPFSTWQIAGNYHLECLKDISALDVYSIGW